MEFINLIKKYLNIDIKKLKRKTIISWMEDGKLNTLKWIGVKY